MFSAIGIIDFKVWKSSWLFDLFGVEFLVRICKQCNIFQKNRFQASLCVIAKLSRTIESLQMNIKCDQNFFFAGIFVYHSIFPSSFYVFACACTISVYDNEQFFGCKTFCGHFNFMNGYKMMVVFILNICAHSEWIDVGPEKLAYHHYCSTFCPILAWLRFTGYN